MLWLIDPSDVSLDAQTTKAPIQALADRVAGHFILGVHALALGVFLFWFFAGYDLWFDADAAGAQSPRTPAWDRVLALPGVHLHLYGKAEPRRGRKMGHLTITASRADDARRIAAQAAMAVATCPPGSRARPRVCILAVAVPG